MEAIAITGLSSAVFTRNRDRILMDFQGTIKEKG